MPFLDQILPRRRMDAAKPLPPIRHDLTGARSLYDAGRELARLARPDLAGARLDPVRRLRENQDRIRANYLAMADAARADETLTPAAEWLVDNHHMVEEHLRQSRESLNRRFLAELPRVDLAGGGRVPRALLIAWHFVALTNSDIGRRDLDEFLRGYQSVTPLTIAELWAVPAFLRYVLIENLRRLSDRVTLARQRRKLANDIADEVMAQPGPLAALGVMNRHAALADDDTIAAQLVYRLREGGADAQAALLALERQLGGAEASRRSVQAEYTRQSSGNVTVGNIMRGLRHIGEIDWLEWFEEISHVDLRLARLPEYGMLDQATRTAYRSEIERIARRSDRDELQVTDLAVDLATADAGGQIQRTPAPTDPQPGGLGHVLVGSRRAQLRAAAGYRPPALERIGRVVQGLREWGLILPLLAITAVALGVLSNVLPSGLSGWQVALLLALAALPASETAMQLLGYLAGRTAPPRRLPGYDFRASVPPDARTLVVIPGMITSDHAVDELLETLESHYLANPQPQLFFALLTDWRDADAETRPDDAALLDRARAGIEDLADRYDDGPEGRFFLLHRARRWNPAEGVWMGWERKRGKLAELNRLLRGAPDTSFLDTSFIDGATPPDGIRYVVTLDSDTRLPRDTVAALVGKMAHPVNQPVHGPGGQVIRGHAILQPRVTPSLATGPDVSRFQRIFSANRGLDPYVFAVSDLYQDLFDAGSFTGKGIYDVDAFERATHGRIAENTILSHDLLEGSLARAGLVSDIEVVEDFPLSYATEASRQHRWMRGDWQLLPLILSPRSGLDGLSRFKMLDNLRRALMAPAWVAAAVAGWLILPGWWAAAWQAALLLLASVSAILRVDLRVLRPGHNVPWRWHLRGMAQDAGLYLTQLGVRLTTVAHRAAQSVDAMGRSLYRMGVSRRHLLEWTTSRDAASASGAGRRGMIAGPVLGVGAVLLVAALNPSALPVALLVGGLWAASPLVMARLSRPVPAEDVLPLTDPDRAELRAIARRTWRYFEEFVTPESHHLPPDNWQANPAPKLAERTSPTNIGLYLMSVVSAQDFGWISRRAAVDRIEATITTMERMARFRGHFFNWYDTRTLAVLPAPYVSSVDSGNLAGLLIALAQALKGWARQPDAPPSAEGLRDTLALLRQTAQDGDAKLRRAVDAFEAELARAIDDAGQTGAQRGAYVGAQDGLPSGAQDAGNPDARTPNWPALTAAADRIAAAAEGGPAQPWAQALLRDLDHAAQPGPAPHPLRLDVLAERARALAFQMDFALLLQPEKKLLSIGYRPDEQELDQSSYDLLASEARLASFLAIAKGDVPREHWARLGRPFAYTRTRGVMMSWSGCMFEYLMPPLLLKEPQGGILQQSNRNAVIEQIAWGRSHSLPWGISESAFNGRDREMNYQYYAFGVPTLGLKRSSGDYVAAPYASILAAQIAPTEALANLRRLRALGAEGDYGFFDAVDFNPARQRDGSSHVVVENVMAHHHGMSIMAIANVVLDGIHRRRFHDDPVVRASDLILQEKNPHDISPVTRPPESAGGWGDAVAGSDTTAFVADPATAPRQVALLSNGVLNVHISATGAGSSTVGHRAINRFTPDPTVDDGGIHILLRDVQTGEWWSATDAPCQTRDERSSALLSDHKAEFFKTANALESRLEVITATEANADGRRLTLRNRSGSAKVIEVTSYAEIVLDDIAADRAHPAFSKMFVETEIRRAESMIAAIRRPRDPRGQAVYLAHVAAGPDGLAGGFGGFEAETDRRAFIGRGRTLATAAAMQQGHALGGHDGHTLDPIFAIRRRISLKPGQSAQVVFWTLTADTPDTRDRLAAHYARPAVFDHESRLAWTRSQVELRHLNVTLPEARLFRDFAAHLIWPDLRLAADASRRAQLGRQADLWAMGISGDDPILLLRIDDEADLPVIRQAMRMHVYLRARGVRHDLVILNEHAASYAQDLQHAIEAAVEVAHHAHHPAAPRHVHAVRADTAAPDSVATLQAAARISLHTRNGRLAEQIERHRTQPRLPETGALVGRGVGGAAGAVAGRAGGATSGGAAGAASGAAAGRSVGGVADAAASGDAAGAANGVAAGAGTGTDDWSAAGSATATARASTSAATTARSITPTPARTLPRPTRRGAFPDTSLGLRDPAPLPPSTSPLEFWNGFGGFSADGREYVLRLDRTRHTPQPWINVIGREDFGFHVSAEGAAFSWAVNSRDHQITPWSNDPVSNRLTDSILIHDPATGRTASPFLALAQDDRAVHEAAHGLGYSRFSADHGWLVVDATMTLAETGPARLTRLRLTNRTDRVLHLHGMACAELVLGSDRSRTAPMVQTRFDAEMQALLARNPYGTGFADRVTALALDGEISGFCGDRGAYLGRNGSHDRPAALDRWPGADARGENTSPPGVNAAGDPCAALRWDITLDSGETAERTLILANATAPEMDALLAAARAPGAFDRAMEAQAREWDATLGRLQVKTPDRRLDLMVNTWLPYQAISCRVRARSAFYQASGAFGFRDQLQDTAALIFHDPTLCRRQILNAAGRQFPQGDVQHWWLPASGAGVRTMIADDVVWLAQITAHYVSATGDRAVLDEPVPFIDGPALEPGEHDRFFQPDASGLEASLYDHCATALDFAIARTGPHDLPLILGGDWNDGMNRVGEKGRGESVWLGWFLCATLDAFAPLARARGDTQRADLWLAHRDRVARALDRDGWDGAWYRRGFYDDGSPLGSVESAECRIDSIAQSWALISGAGRPDRARIAVDAALQQLYDSDARMLRLFTPPFQNTAAEPGYIKSYPPGVRENGGQYTHAAAWMVYALGRSGDATRAHRLFDALNPISHALDPRSASHYRVEPYVVAADVYAGPDRAGRGGWTWYTGSAGWMYRAAVEGVLGLSLTDGAPGIEPRLPDNWPGFSVTMQRDDGEWSFTVTRDAAGEVVVEDREG